MNKLSLLTLLAACSLPNWGASVNSNTVTFDFSDASSVLSFDPFDTTLGTLTKVEILFLSGSRTVITGRPTQSFSGGCGGNYSYSMSVDAGGFLVSVGFGSGSLTSGTCGTSDFNIHSFLPPRTVSNATNMSLFEGAGSVDVTLGRGAITVTDIASPIVRFDGDAQLRYTFDPVPEVPEPGTWGLLAAGSLAGLMVSRWRQSR